MNNQTLTRVWKLYVHIFVCLMVIKPWLNLPTGDHGHMICIGNLGGVFLVKILQKATQRPTKVNFFPYKQVSGRNGEHEWLRMTNAFILCDLLWKVQKCYAANREGCFNLI